MHDFILITTTERTYIKSISPLLNPAQELETIQQNYFPGEVILDWHTLEAANLDEEERRRKKILTKI